MRSYAAIPDLEDLIADASQIDEQIEAWRNDPFKPMSSPECGWSLT